MPQQPEQQQRQPRLRHSIILHSSCTPAHTLTHLEENLKICPSLKLQGFLPLQQIFSPCNPLSLPFAFPPARSLLVYSDYVDVRPLSISRLFLPRLSLRPLSLYSFFFHFASRSVRFLRPHFCSFRRHISLFLSLSLPICPSLSPPVRALG